MEILANTKNINIPSNTIFIIYDWNSIDTIPQSIIYLNLSVSGQSSIKLEGYLLYLHLKNSIDVEVNILSQYLLYLHLRIVYPNQFKEFTKYLLYLSFSYSISHEIKIMPMNLIYLDQCNYEIEKYPQSLLYYKMIYYPKKQKAVPQYLCLDISYNRLSTQYCKIKEYLCDDYE